MSRKRSATVSIQESTQADTTAPNVGADSGATPGIFRANVFTWTGPGVENIFIDFEPALERKRRTLWKDGVADGRREVS
jgi:hypothetical protein